MDKAYGTFLLTLAVVGTALSFKRAQAASNEMAVESRIVVMSATPSPTPAPMAVEIQSPMNLGASTLAYDLNNTLMGDEMVQKVDAQYSQRLRDFYLSNGYYVLSRDSPHAESFGNNTADEAKFRSDMANAMKNFMIQRGIPNFLTSRDETKGFGKAYQKTMDLVQNTAKIGGSSESKPAPAAPGAAVPGTPAAPGTAVAPLPPLVDKNKIIWKYEAGLNPLTLRAYANVSTQKAKLELLDELKTNSVSVIASGNWRRYTTSTSFTLVDKTLHPTISRSFGRSTNGSLYLTIPVTADDVLDASSAGVSMSYSF